MDNTKIDWCDSTWNPVTGCLHGCEYCYARKITERFGTLFKGDILPEDEGLSFLPDEPERFYELDEPVRDNTGRIEPFPANFYPTFYRYKLDEPQKWKKGRNIFVCSMADLFGEWVPDSWIEEVFKACKNAPQHNYLFLTKNPKRYIEMEKDKKLPWADNFWFGTTVTRPNMQFTWFKDKKFHWFLSIEPILERFGEIEPKDCMPEWVIIGAETGKRKDKVIPKKEWVEHIFAYCNENNIPVFMKSSLSDIWGEPLIQELPVELLRK